MNKEGKALDESGPNKDIQCEGVNGYRALMDQELVIGMSGIKIRS